MLNKLAYEWDFAGACAPGEPQPYGHNTTFSVGIFQWVPKKNGKGLKRGKVVKRIRGYCNNPEMVYEDARAECARRNGEVRHANT